MSKLVFKSDQEKKEYYKNFYRKYRETINKNSLYWYNKFKNKPEFKAKRKEYRLKISKEGYFFDYYREHKPEFIARNKTERYRLVSSIRTRKEVINKMNKNHPLYVKKTKILNDKINRLNQIKSELRAKKENCLSK